jgi:hypothetical protein
MAISKIKNTEMIYHLNGDKFTLYSVNELLKEMERDGFAPESEIEFDKKSGAVKVTMITAQP